MEFVHIIFAIGVGIPIAFAYSWLLPSFSERIPGLRIVAVFASAIVVLICFVEIVSTLIFGIVGARTRLGCYYTAAHIITYFFLPGAAATIVVSIPNSPSHKRRFFGGVAATCLLLFLLMYNLKWADTLYGIDGEVGPFGRPSAEEPTSQIAARQSDPASDLSSLKSRRGSLDDSETLCF